MAGKIFSLSSCTDSALHHDITKQIKNMTANYNSKAAINFLLTFIVNTPPMECWETALVVLNFLRSR